MPSDRTSGHHRRTQADRHHRAQPQRLLLLLPQSYRDVGPLVEGPGDVYICGECIELCQSIIDQEKTPPRRHPRPLSPNIPSPRTIKEKLDQYVIGQEPGQEGPLASPSTTTTSG